jgi:hypothetical protein
MAISDFTQEMASIRMAARGWRTPTVYGLVMIFDCKTKQAAVFIGRDQFEGPGITGFLGIGSSAL